MWDRLTCWLPSHQPIEPIRGGSTPVQTKFDCPANDSICTAIQSTLPNVTWAPLVAWAITVVIILLGALVLRTLINRVILRITQRAASGVLPERLRGRTLAILDNGAIMTERRRQRAETLGSVLRSLASVIILGTAVLMIMARLGIELAPLLTSVGILGVAVGFGAQELVKDFIAGVFMLLEDQYGVGDHIDTGQAIGTVESVTLRITRLRDADGKVWYVRNGTITRIGNESQGWSRAVVDVPVAYETDITAVRELLTGIAQDLWQDPDYHETVIVEEPQVFGLEQISDKALIFRINVKTVPNETARVARELRLRVKQAFDARGLVFVAA
ncbi:mechanosensitive ion channel family protein [Streptosporangiaceae bacterium NEAU-GS5]|nr:mechanosensitive ion channel family protein [Streptosporangiaceae bacterium NEAU-GS5]